jgi:hypothetical protein
MQDDDKIPVNARYDQSLLKRVDDWRRRQPTIPARSEALRELVRRALNAEKAARKRVRLASAPSSISRAANAG